jgi:hypothetical protein
MPPGKDGCENARELIACHKIARGNGKAANAALTNRADKIIDGFHERQK